MHTLHIINKPGSPLSLCQRALRANDGIILIEEGVYLLAESAATVKTLSHNHSVYVLEADLSARGLPLSDSAKPVSYHQFVTLATEYERSISWY